VTATPATREPQHVHALTVRVRYPEADPMGRCHHSVFPVYFEMGRTEYMRERGVTYAEMEASGFFIAIVDLQVKYKAGARYDDVLEVRTWVDEVRGARVFFANRVVRHDPTGEALIVEGRVCGALIGRDGHPRRFSDDEAALMLGPPKT
jgi:acyl-CoA thioester hydrolase